MKFYKIGFPQNSVYGIGSPENANNSFIVPNDGKITDWKTIFLRLEDGPFSDYQGSNPVCRLCSKKFKTIIDHGRSESDEIQWLPVKLINEQGEQREYFILHFPVSYDVLDRGRSIIVDMNHIVKPVFSLEKISNHKVFNYNSDNVLSFIISEDIKIKIEAAHLTNIVFSEAPLVK
ncbi:MAG: imm11 family protein [Candidatus Thorarchaeota archaeon]